jgi:septal ring factor EnvC (AmiA/AmiB activator)
LLVQQSSLDAQRDELDKVRKERQQALAKLNDDVKARDQKLQPASRTRQTWPKSSRPSKKPWPARPARRRSAAESADRPAGSGKSVCVRPNWQPPATLRPRKPVKHPWRAGFQRRRDFGGPLLNPGKLPWPVDGRLLARFGESRGDDARAKWDGVMISASAGSQVHAVAVAWCSPTGCAAPGCW